MKKYAITCAFLLLAFVAFAQNTIYYNSSPTLLWDPVLPELAGDVIEYEVYLWDMANGDPLIQPITAFISFGTTALTQIPLTFTYRAEWAVAVRTKLTDGGANVGYSALSHSVVSEDAGGSPFYYVPLSGLPLAPASLRDSGT